MRAVLQNRDTRVPTEAGFSSKIGAFPPNSGRLATLLGILGVQGHGMLPRKKNKKLEVFELLEMH